MGKCGLVRVFRDGSYALEINGVVIISDDDIELIGDIEALQGVKKFPVRIKCALLGWSALEDLIKKP